MNSMNTDKIIRAKHLVPSTRIHVSYATEHVTNNLTPLYGTYCSLIGVLARPQRFIEILQQVT